MYKIIHNGELKAVCDSPRYVRKKPETGAYIVTTADKAEAVAVQGEPLPINEVIICEVDGGLFNFNEYVHKGKYDSDIATLEDAICEIDEGASNE